jgi:DNA end-binding protein Ku
VEFVDLDQINPMYFDTPYFLEPEKKSRHAYALLRESLRVANKVGIAKVVIRSREHLAALKPNGDALVLELMHFADEMVAQTDFEFPELKEKVAPAELQMAKMLIDSMTAEAFEPEKFTDDYREGVMKMIDARVAGEEVSVSEAKPRMATNVVNLMDVLQRSLEASKHGGMSSRPKGVSSAKAAPKKSASAAKPKRKKTAA